MTSDPTSIPEAPEPLIAWMERYGDLSGDADALAGAAVEALKAASARLGRQRDSAYALLAADGLMTCALERLGDSPAPEAGMRRLIETIASSRLGGPG